MNECIEYDLETRDRLHNDIKHPKEGHPPQWLQLNTRVPHSNVTCPYCGLRYFMSHHAKENKNEKMKLWEEYRKQKIAEGKLKVQEERKAKAAEREANPPKPLKQVTATMGAFGRKPHFPPKDDVYALD